MIQKTRPFLILWLLFVVVGAVLLASFTKAQLLLSVNQHHFGFFDWLMPYWTLFGEGWTAIALVILLIIYGYKTAGKSQSIRFGWIGLLVFTIPSLLSMFLKQEFFNREPRPVTYFASTPEVLHHVPGVELWTYNSFPSGHTITAFSIPILLMYLVIRDKRWAWALGLFAWACSVGYSRMYLAEHFFKDVYGGSIIGVVSSLAAIWIGESTVQVFGGSRVSGESRSGPGY
jgi:membrane-associated phospholipid phosphatase